MSVLQLKVEVFTMNSLITVVVPVYNGEKFIERAINSIFKQTYNNYEIIVVNDGSIDKTDQIVDDLVKRYKCIKLFNQANKGVSSARNKGIDEAKGEYIAFLDADDEYDPNFLAKTLQCLEKEQADICVVRKLPNVSTSDNKIYSQNECLQLCVQDNPLIYACHDKLYKASFLKDNSVYFPIDKQAHEDSFFVFDCFINGANMVHLNENYYKYNEDNKNSLSRSGFSEKKFAIIDLAQIKYDILNINFPEFKDKSINILIKAYMSLLFQLVGTYGYRSIKRKCIHFIQKNKKSFISYSSFDRKFFLIITKHLYWLFSLFYLLKICKEKIITCKRNIEV